MFTAAVLALFFDADVHRLGSPDWRTRQAAHARLDARYPISLPALAFGSQSRDPEIRVRCGLVVGRHRPPWETIAAAYLIVGPGGDFITHEQQVWLERRPEVAQKFPEAAEVLGIWVPNYWHGCDSESTCNVLRSIWRRRF